MPFPTPNYAGLPPITSDLNHLYKKHTVVVYPSEPIGRGSMGGQKVSFGTPYRLVCNVQLRRLDEHDEPVKFDNQQGRLYTEEYGKLKEHDEFEFQGSRYKIDGVENYKDNVRFLPHHSEAIFTQTQSSAPRTPQQP